MSDAHQNDRLRLRRTEAARLGLTGMALYRHLFGPPALPSRRERLHRLGEGYRTARRLRRGCPYARAGFTAGLSAESPSPLEG